MKNVFIAIGGSGAKVAEAVVRMLAMGFPTKIQNGGLTSSSDHLEVWRVDPDRSSGAAEDLKQSVAEYGEIQRFMSDGSGVGTSRWAMDLTPVVRDLDPLELPGAGNGDNEIKTLRGVLDSQHGASHSTLPILSPFFATKDLDVVIDRGFYQKPFIGSAVMSIFANSLEDDSSPSGKKAGLNAYNNTPTNFFLCGSLHGGTGACGVPVMAQFLHRRKIANPGWGWRIGGCMMAPFVKPPNPPFQPLAEGTEITDADIAGYLSVYGNTHAFQGLNDGEKAELVKQILLGFFADPENMEERARQGLTYYKDHTADYFDELFLVGKPNPNQLRLWSNGGRTQKNPLNSADIVAAIAALNFFSGSRGGGINTYSIASSDFEIPQETMRLFHLPSYRVGDAEIDPEKVFLASALTNHLVIHQFPWDKIKESAGDFKLCAFYESRMNQKDQDQGYFSEALRIIASSIGCLVRPHSEQFPTGWSNEDAVELWNYLSAEPDRIAKVQLNLERKFMSKRAKGTSKLGISEAEFTTFDYGEWCPDGDQFTRGEYLRHVWRSVHGKCATQLGT